MAEKKRVPTEKSPVGAAVLSAIIPTLGFFYIGNAAKIIAYVFTFIALIVLGDNCEEKSGELVFGLMTAGFYIFQIFDSYNEAKKTHYREIPKAKEEKTFLFISVYILLLGIFFQLGQLKIIEYKDFGKLAKLWPLILIIIGARFIYTYTISSKEDKEDEYHLEKRETGVKNE